MTTDYIRTSQAAELLDEPIRGIYARIEEGELQAFEVPGAKHPVIRVRRVDVEALVARTSSAD